MGKVFWNIWFVFLISALLFLNMKAYHINNWSFYCILFGQSSVEPNRNEVPSERHINGKLPAMIGMHF